MQIPKRLSYILERDPALDGAVKYAISQFEPWIKHSQLPFFPEYTDHGIDHIEGVLRTASGMIRDEAWEAITSPDAAVLVLSVLLHDCAMHLSEDGFFALLDEERSIRLIPEMRDKPWNHLWEDFFGEAARFDGRQLVRLFGDAQPVRRPPMDSNALSKRDRLLIGEFLRRHHPRLAQEIAIFGVPGSAKNTPLVLGSFDGGNQHIARLAGLVARSHGADIRSFLPILRDEFDVRQFKSVHPVILMALLRVADYLQIEAERAPAQVLQIRQLASPVSEGEWKAHHAIKDIRHTHEDPEAIYIDAEPGDVETFLRVRGWLDGIQRELDASWAVIGEVYGRYEGLKEFGIVLRRVRSSLDDVEAFSQRVSYLPVKAMFRAADADLLKLLIEPLYGDYPEVGLRELIQNAVDACRELKEYLDDLGANAVDQVIQDADVQVKIDGFEGDRYVVVISDKGIGMSRGTVINYFLTAGASFRRSEDWRKAFESEEGKSRVLRAGRFGVGALASFLLGSEIEVSTRHVDELCGLRFKASVESDAIELTKYDRPVGTTITISLLKPVVDRLMKTLRDEELGHRWDWYCLAKPSVDRVCDNHKLKQEYVLPDVDGADIGVWHRIDHDDFAGILWTYSRSAPPLVCNGIKVQSPGYEYLRGGLSWSRKNGFRDPRLAVFDPDGKLPLNLQRTELAEQQLPFDKELLESICRDFIAFSLARGPIALPATLGVVDAFNKFAYEGSLRARSGWDEKNSRDWFFNSHGFGYINASAFRGKKSVLAVRVSGVGDYKIPFSPPKSQPVIPVVGDRTLTGLDWWTRNMLDLGFYDTTDVRYRGRVELGGEGVFDALTRKGVRLLLSSFALSRSKSKLPKYLAEALVEEEDFGGWNLVAIGTCPKSEFDFRGFVREASGSLNSFSGIAEVYLGRQGELEDMPVAKMWSSILGVDVIPFSPAVRSRRCKSAYEELQIEIESHLSVTD